MQKTLRPYQVQALESTRRLLQQYGSTVVVLPTGLGKTVYAAKLIAEWDQGNCLFIAHTRELIAQSADKLGHELGYKPVIEMNIEGADPESLYQGGLVVVGSVQSMISDRRLDKYRNHGFGLVVVDECHHATSASYRKVIDYFRDLNPGCKVVGITATPNRSDGAALGIVFESVAYQVTIEDAINDGWLVPIRQEVVTVEGLDFTGVSVKKNTLGEQDFSPAQLEAVLMEEENLHGMAMAALEKLGDRKAIIFTAGVEQARLLADVLNRYKPNSAKFVCGETEKEERKKTLADFSTGPLQFVANCQVLTEGFDSPTCSAIVMGRPTKSLSLYIQMLGRGLRPLAGVADGHATDFDRKMAILTSEKSNCLVLDFAGVSNHKLVDALDVLGGSYDVETRDLVRREAGDGPKNIAEILELAKHLAGLRVQSREREAIKAQAVQFKSYETNPFGDGQSYSAPVGDGRRGGASDKQIGLLVSLGVKYEVAAGYSKKQAGAVIDSMGTSRCTERQARVLVKHGIPTAGVGIERASRIIDAIANNGWKRPEVIPE